MPMVMMSGVTAADSVDADLNGGHTGTRRDSSRRAA